MENLVVLNFGRFLSAPLVAKFLKQMGCKIINIKPPKYHNAFQEELRWNEDVVQDFLMDGDVLEHVDLPSQQHMIIRYITMASVLLENFRPGVMDRLGLSYEYCKQLNPSLIYVSLPGFYSGDKNYSGMKAWEASILASSGVFKDMGLNRQLMHVHSSYSSLPMASVYGSIFATFGIMTKLFLIKRLSSSELIAKESTKIEVPLASALSEALVHNSVEFECPYSYLNSRQRILVERKEMMSFQETRDLLDPFYCHYICKDGRPFYVVAPCHLSHQIKLLKAMNIDYEHYQVADPYNTSSGKQHGLGGNETGFQAVELKKILIKKFKERNAQEWESILGEAGVPCSAHNSFPDWLNSKHCKESGLVTFVDGKCKLGPLTWLKDVLHVESGPDFECNSVPQYALSGIKVLDCSNVIAGPTIGSMFARSGAEVIKIDSTEPSYSTLITIVYGLCANRGKKSILLNLKEEEDFEIFSNLVKDSHVVIMNSTDDRMKKINLHIHSLRKMNPSIILVHFDAWGGPLEKGRMKDFLGYDDNVQACQGIMERFGGQMNFVEEHAHIGTIDVIAGVAGCISGIHALINLMLKKEASVSRTSLSSVGQYLQYPFSCFSIATMRRKALISFDRLGYLCRGRHALYRSYESADDNFLLIAALNFSKKCLSDVVERVTQRKVPNKLLEICLVEAFKFFKISDIQRLLPDCTVVPLVSIKYLREKNTQSCPDLRGDTFQFIERESTKIGLGRYIICAPVAVRMDHIRLELDTAPQYGEDCHSIIQKNRSWNEVYIPYADECPICCRVCQKKFKFECGHFMCLKCVVNCVSVNHHECPFCRHSQNLDLNNVDHNVKVFKEQYRNWRKGHKKGARDMHLIRKVRSDASLAYDSS